MDRALDYYMVPASPWTYLGHQRLLDLCERHRIAIRILPFDLNGQVFPLSGGLPLGKRAPQRQAYRLIELARWRDFTGIPLNPQPRFFPVAGDQAALAIIAADQLHGSAAALRLAGGVLRAVWAEERNIADELTLSALISEAGLDPAPVLGHRQSALAQYESNTRQAIEQQVFGAPWYVWHGQPFWGQDRLDLLERAIAKG